MASELIKYKYEVGCRIENDNVFIFIFSNKDDFNETLNYLKSIKNELSNILSVDNITNPEIIDINTIKFSNNNQNNNIELTNILLKKLLKFNIKE